MNDGNYRGRIVVDPQIHCPPLRLATPEAVASLGDTGIQPGCI